MPVKSNFEIAKQYADILKEDAKPVGKNCTGLVSWIFSHLSLRYPEQPTRAKNIAAGVVRKLENKGRHY